MSTILLVNSDKKTAAIFQKILKTEGYKVTVSSDLAEARKLLEDETFNLMIQDVAGNWDPELELSRAARDKNAAMSIILVSEAGNPNIGTKVSEFNPFAALQKPLKVDKLLATVQKAIDFNDAQLAKGMNLNLQLETNYQFAGIVAESPAMKGICEMISRIAAADVTVLIAGEPGTGKTAIARAIHDSSRRKKGPFVLVDCRKDSMNIDGRLFGEGGAEGALENAATGTLFLLGVEALPAAVQKRLLATLQNRKFKRIDNQKEVAVDVRIVAAAPANPQRLVDQGKMSPEFFKYLKVIYLQIPPLRERPQDVMPSVRLVLRNSVGEGSALPSIDGDAADVLGKYAWPGNVTEMEQVLAEAMKVSPGRITRSSLPAKILS